MTKTTPESKVGRRPIVRPEGDVPVSLTITIPRKLREALENWADDEGASLSGTIRRLLERNREIRTRLSA